uniref:Uncharacterized protein n=1 Tax=Trichinella nativa TaxID=6335 RepID=A0A0V1KGP5_9BILA
MQTQSPQNIYDQATSDSQWVLQGGSDDQKRKKDN